MVAFWFVERRAEEPVLPLWVFRHRVLVGGNLDRARRRRAADRPTSFVPKLRAGSWARAPSGRVRRRGDVAGLADRTRPCPAVSTCASGSVIRACGRRGLVAGTVVCAPCSGGYTGILLALACRRRGVGLGLMSSPTSSPCSRWSAGTAVGWSPAPTCSFGRSAARSAVRCSARSLAYAPWTGGSAAAPARRAGPVEAAESMRPTWCSRRKAPHRRCWSTRGAACTAAATHHRVHRAGLRGGARDRDAAAHALRITPLP